jgi:transcriptional regulator with XRE-family HTH domain
VVDARRGGSPTVLRIVVGKQLEELRKKAGFSYEQAAEAIGMSHATIRRMEAAKVARLRPPDVEMLLRTYGITDQGEIDAFVGVVREANRPGWWHTYRDVMPSWFSAFLSLEETAHYIRAYEAQFVHELLQTEDYARAQLTAEAPHAPADVTERRVALRMQRQELLTRRHGPRLWVVMDETVLRWAVGGPDVMRDQIDHLIQVSALPNVILQLMPFSEGPHPATRAGSFHFFRFKVPELPDVVYSDNLARAVYLDKREDVTAYQEALDRLCAQAAPQDRTQVLLGGIRNKL